jgi:hypothetical protein
VELTFEDYRRSAELVLTYKDLPLGTTDAYISQWSYRDLHTMRRLVFPADPLLIVRRDLRWQPSPAARILLPPAADQSLSSA